MRHGALTTVVPPADLVEDVAVGSDVCASGKLDAQSAADAGSDASHAPQAGEAVMAQMVVRIAGLSIPPCTGTPSSSVRTQARWDRRPGSGMPGPRSVTPPPPASTNASASELGSAPRGLDLVG